MDRCRVLFCIAWVFIQVDGTYDIQAHTNANEIENQWIILEESVMRDVLELKESLNKIVGDINTAFGEYRAFTEGSVRDLNLHIESDMRKSDETLEKNTMALEEYTKTKVREMNKTLLENLQTLSETMAQERSSIVDWANQRSSFHEDILKTDVALCAYDDIQNSRGVVNYNGRHSGYINDQKRWRVFNESCSQESCAREVLNRQTGRFTVPKNADGLYLFTFSITMDTWDFIEGNTWDYYCFRKNGHEVIGTGLYGNVGSNEDSDKVPGSRTILLELNSGDVIDVYQRQEKNIPDRQASFCGSLIHLKKASESPGGWASESSHDLFPKIMTSFEPNNVSFDPQTFEDVANAYGTFTHKTEDDTPTSRTQVQQDWLAKWELQSDNEATFITTVVDDIEL
jgi:hypothetical protein